MNSTFEFSRASYRAILERACALDYRICNFRSFVPPAEQPVLLLRHDLDHSIRSAVVLAEIEAELGLQATYFVLVGCDFYNLLSSESRAHIARITELGHEIGLHYEAPHYVGAEGRQRLATSIALLADLAGHPIRSASQHIPIDNDFLDLSGYIDQEAYEARFTKGAMTYISDSLMRWRQATPHDLLDSRSSFQLLTHPMKWVADFSDMDQALAFALHDEQQFLAQRSAQIAAYYRDLLSRRAELDAAFKASRRHQGEA